MKFFADDSFRGHDGVWGGDVVDQGTPFVMRDKLSHFLGGALLFASASRFLGVPWAVAVVQGCGIGVEVLEVWRLYRGKVRLADRFSWRDLVANNVGALFAWLLL